MYGRIEHRVLCFTVRIYGCFSLKLAPFRDNYLVYSLMITSDTKQCLLIFTRKRVLLISEGNFTFSLYLEIIKQMICQMACNRFTFIDVDLSQYWEREVIKTKSVKEAKWRTFICIFPN